MAAKKKGKKPVAAAKTLKHKELKALNEELTTCNKQLRDKIGELESAHHDMANFLNCTDIAIIFLDTQLQIRRFTPPVTQLLSVVAADTGRSITDIELKFTDPDLAADAQHVLQNLTPRDKIVNTLDGRACMRRLTPLHTADNRTEGVVITFIDITEHKRAAEGERRRAEEHNSLMYALPAFVWIAEDAECRHITGNEAANRFFGVPIGTNVSLTPLRACDRISVQHFKEDGTEYLPEDLPMQRAVAEGEPVRDAFIEFRFQDGNRVQILGNVVPLFNPDRSVRGVIAAFVDISERMRLEKELKRLNEGLTKEVERRTASLQESESRLRAILNAPDDAIITVDHRGVIDSVNTAAQTMFGYAAGEMIGNNVDMLMPPPHQSQHNGYLARFLRTGDARIIGIGREVRARRKDGTTFWTDLSVSEVEGRGLFTGIIRDTTLRKELEREVVEIATLVQQRIGQDLHDDCGQRLTALGLMIASLAEPKEERAPADVELVRKAGVQLNDVLRQVRNVAQGLAQAEVKAAHLHDALQELTSRLGETSGIGFAFKGGAAQVDDDSHATHVFHIAQEACTNALKHAKAHNITVGLRKRYNAVVLEIRDDGLGIPDDVNPGLGMRIMRHRASVIGARLSIGRAMPQGTLVACTLTKEYPHDRE